MVPASSLWTVFGTSILPIIELKGAIPLGLGLGVPFWATYFIALLGSCLPAPFIVFFIEKIIRWMQGSKVKLFNRFANWLMGKVDKHKGKIEKYGYRRVYFRCYPAARYGRMDRVPHCERPRPETREGHPARYPW